MLEPPASAGHGFKVEIGGADPHAASRTLRVTGPGGDGVDRTLEHHLPDTGQNAWLDLFQVLSGAFGTRPPLSRTAVELPRGASSLQPLLTEPISPDILYGYGDPSVVRVDRAGEPPVWYLLVTSNDAPNAFPILRSETLRDWRLTGFVFPEGRTPEWTLTGENAADFWAPEMHRVGAEYWVCFAAREHDRSLAIGLARSSSPEGPFDAIPAPLVGGGVIDPHIRLDHDGAPWLLWKDDDNGVWPPLLADFLHEPGRIDSLFPEEVDRRTAALLQTLDPWTQTLEPMERFCVEQPLIEAVTADFSGFRERLEAMGDVPGAPAILHALKTRVWAQRLAPDGGRLVGERQLVLVNDQPWEAHLIEGVWATEHDGRCYIFYAGNDFSTPHYGIGVAVADHPLGIYVKQPDPLLGSTAEWVGPGHPSVAPGPDGRPRLFLHAYPPGQVGYKAFRALLTTEIRFEEDRVSLGPSGPAH
ncbi:MAG: family 43 glycosylhydrolase [Proteobacteria bacterium]|nr:family 43 glycosylhydrolase [Pseudomonadota bacterium]